MKREMAARATTKPRIANVPMLDNNDAASQIEEPEIDEERFDTLHERALDDPDPAVRLAGIEAAVDQRDEDGFDLLWLAVNSDDDPDNRLTAVSELEQMLMSGRGDGEQIRQLLEETAEDADPRVADLSQLIIHEQFGGPALPPHEAQERADEAPYDDDPTDFEDELDTDAETFETLSESALFDSDSAVRLGVIETISNQHEAYLDLLEEAALYDHDPDNRLAAVSRLEQLLMSNLGNREQILYLLEDATRDLDPRVAELSELIIREQRDDS